MGLRSHWIGRVVLLVACLLASGPAPAQATFITVASTTSTEQSGLFGHLLPIFVKATGIQVRIIALGTGQALDTGRRGDVDLVFVHDRAAEEAFVAAGYGVDRRNVMYNDFVLVGPKDDTAGVAAATGIRDAFRKIAASRPPFVSRGDRSGTHSAELRYWAAAGIELDQIKGSWYRETGSGMGPALNTADAMNAYILVDRGTWLSFRNRGGLKVLVQGDPETFNQYGILMVNPARHAHVKREPAQAFVDWITRPQGQAAIASYRIGGEQLFFPNARP